uniref:Major head protein n=1 Tax=Siphoviridae sp. ctiJI15 TaxID=2826431 RepID=A0A8S5NJ50_9CAUD|nr:MAG TPA: Major head protein [Siphoviridae sp. ctiJI15]
MEQENNQNVNSEAENSKGTETSKSERTNYEELIKTDKELQSFLDSRVSSSNKTAIENAKKQWELERDTQKSEAEKLAQMNETQKLQYQLKKQEEANQEIQRKLNARDLKDEALKIATTQDTAFDPEFLNLFDYENMTAEQLQDKTKLIKAIQDRIVEKAVNEWSKEKPPYNPDPSGNKSSADEAIRKAMGLK